MKLLSDLGLLGLILCLAVILIGNCADDWGKKSSRDRF